MNANELIEKVIAKLSGDPELLKIVGDLTLDKEDVETASSQRPDTMYVLTGRVQVKSDGDEPQYHYHPIIEDCFLNPNATENRMVCSESLIKMQELQRQQYFCPGVETVILAVSMENYEKLQQMLDETIAEMMGSIRHVAEEVLKENEKLLPFGSVDFYGIYQAVMMHMINSAHTVIGAGLTGNSEIIESLADIEYENPVPDDDYDDFDIFDECYGDCDSCDRECCCDECVPDDEASKHIHGTFYGTIKHD